MDGVESVGFGPYRWRVLARDGGRVLLLTEDIVEQRDYNDRKGETTWKESELRSYLNGAFLERFSAAERDGIRPVRNDNPDNPWYPGRGGGASDDRVFLLTLDDAVRRFFGDSGRLLDFPKPNQRYWFDRKDPNNAARQARFAGSSWWWWLRTPGKNNRVAVYVHGDGNIGIQGNGVAKTSFNTLHPASGGNQGGVRPALWVAAGALT